VTNTFRLLLVLAARLLARHEEGAGGHPSERGGGGHRVRSEPPRQPQEQHGWADYTAGAGGGGPHPGVPVHLHRPARQARQPPDPVVRASAPPPATPQHCTAQHRKTQKADYCVARVKL